jgi:ubiquinone/menaquinone biosynthesis C-methylase UbiE
VVFSDVDVAKAQLERISRQFDFGPYPRIAIDKDPREDFAKLFVHDIRTAFYLRDRKIKQTEGSLILDVGCGTGYKTLMLALANPGAHVVGVDLSEKSLELAQQRAEFHGCSDIEFRQLSLDQLGQLQREFDYINCDEMLYLLEDPAVGLQNLKSVLKPEGIIRTNLHSKNQRQAHFRIQELCHFLGLMNENPEDFEIEAIVSLLNALAPGTRTRQEAWRTKREGDVKELKEVVLMNFLFHEDKGFTIPQLREFLERSDLYFLSMTQWRGWHVSSLFENPEEVPALIELGLGEGDALDKAYFFDLINPIHRLFDCWLSPQAVVEPELELIEMPAEELGQLAVSLHPQLQTYERTREALETACRKRQRFSFTRLLSHGSSDHVEYDSLYAGLLLPLLERAHSIHELAHRWLRLSPYDPLAERSISDAEAQHHVAEFVAELERDLYVVLE